MSYQTWVTGVYNEKNWFEVWEELQSHNVFYYNIIVNELGKDRLYKNNKHVKVDKHGLSSMIEKLQVELTLTREILLELGAETHKNKKLYDWYCVNKKEGSDE